MHMSVMRYRTRMASDKALVTFHQANGGDAHVVLDVRTWDLLESVLERAAQEDWLTVEIEEEKDWLTADIEEEEG